MSENERKACPEWCGTARVAPAHDNPATSCRSVHGLAVACYGGDSVHLCSGACAEAGRPISPQIKSGTDAGPVKPTKVEVGQRYMAPSGRVFTLGARDPSGFWRSSDHHSLWSEPFLSERCTYLGTSPEVKPAEEAKPSETCESWCGTANGNEIPDEDFCRAFPCYGGRTRYYCSKGCKLARADTAAPKPSENVQAPPKSAPPMVIRREVSCDGRNWIDYARLVDADPFEAYPWRRIARGDTASIVEYGANESVSLWGEWTVWHPTRKPDPGQALTAGDLAGAAAAALVSRRA